MEPTKGSPAKIPYNVFQGLKIPTTAILEYVQSALSYIPKPGDIFIVSHPKCGTTWLQHIIYLIFSRGKPAKNVTDVISAIPYIEQDGFPQKQDSEILAFKYHVPFESIPFSVEAKYICITRNPKDTCVSYYYFLRNLPSYNIPSFDYFFESFIQGEIPYGDYFDHLISWYEQRHRKNVLFLTYESIIKDHRDVVLKIAEFLGKADSLHKDDIDNIVKYSSLDFMRQLVDGKTMEKYLKGEWRTKGYSSLDDTQTETPVSDGKRPVMIRKGSVGDWTNHFSEEQDVKMNEVFFKKTKGTDIYQLWPDIFNQTVIRE